MTMDTAAPHNVSSQSPVYADGRAGLGMRHGRTWMPAAVAGVVVLLVAEWVGVQDLVKATAPPRPAALIAGLLLGCTGLMLLVALCARRLRALHAAIAQVTAQLERLSAVEPRGGAQLPEGGPPVVARLAQAINGARRRCAERESEMLTVQASYVHDLRTPMTRMVLRCDLIEDPGLRAAMERDLDEMRDLAEAGLACARIQSGVAQKLKLVDVDKVLDVLVQNYHDAGCELHLDGRLGRSLVTCPHALRRILVNLVDNAFRYGSNVRLSVRTECRRLHLAVIDSGPGIAPAELEAVFMPWYRSPKTAARGPGSGLGLAIARRLVNAIGGELRLENRREGGLEARLSLPL